MRAASSRLHTHALLTVALLAAPAAIAQTSPTPPPAPAVAAAPATPAAPPTPVPGIRNKIAAGDLLSAESILEVHREKYREDGAWLAGLGWLARGALLVGDLNKAQAYAQEVRANCVERISKGAVLSRDHDLEGALGTAIEVEAQLRERAHGRKAAAEYMRRELAAWPAGPTAFKARLNKRLNLLTLEGLPAPELVGDPGPADAGITLTSLRGAPVLMFMWAEWCSDCKAQAASLARVLDQHRADGLRVVAVTRCYDDTDSARAVERVRADSVWSAVYSSLGPTRRVISTDAMVRYGVSSTPTFVFIDGKGVVRRYAPTRLTLDELERGVAACMH